MHIQFSADVPDSTYFRTGDAEPLIEEDGSLTLLNGEGTRRSWGRPGVTSTVVLDEEDFIAVHVGFHHKHGGGQFWRYYTTDGTETRPVTWAALPDEQRARILAAYKKAPAWAKVPGKLRANYKKPTPRKRTTYKLVERLADGTLVSLYDGETEYVVGKRLAEKALDEHRGGYYSHPTAEQVLALWEAGDLVPARCYRDAKALVLLECEASGTIIKYANGKLASTYLTPTAVLDTIEYVPANHRAA